MKLLTSPNEIEQLRLERHPCFSEAAHMKWGRVHLAVAPMCNISCKYCLRKLNKIENRPGVAEKILTPEEALVAVKQARDKFPITVVGIAGPGEALANEETFKTFELVNKYHPDLIKCFSTNGLLLSGSIERLKEIRANTITVTANTLSPKTGEKIYNFVNFKSTTYKGRQAAEILIKKQAAGVKQAIKAGFTIKINSVLIPGVNSDEIAEIAKFYSGLGVEIMNIIALIPIYEMAGNQAPTCEELRQARDKAEPYIKQFKKCQQCRADAVGVPGQESKTKIKNTEYFHG
jgi:nitrogen fixation protein NifB